VRRIQRPGRLGISPKFPVSASNRLLSAAPSIVGPSIDAPRRLVNDTIFQGRAAGRRLLQKRDVTARFECAIDVELKRSGGIEQILFLNTKKADAPPDRKKRFTPVLKLWLEIMRIRFAMMAFFVTVGISMGSTTLAQTMFKSQAQLTSCGTPSCGTPACGGSVYGMPNQGGYGYGFNESIVGSSDTSYFYESGVSPQYLGSQYSGAGQYVQGGQCIQPGISSEGYVVGGASMVGGVTMTSMPNTHDGYSTISGGPVMMSADCAPNVGVGGGSGYASNFANVAPGFYGGFEFLWLRPTFGQDVALIIDPPVGNTLVPFDYDNSLSPRAWLGWQTCRGTGVRGSYFRFSDEPDGVMVTAVVGATPVFVNVFGAGSNLTRSANANVGETLSVDHDLTLQAYDIEATQQVCWGTTQAMFGLGVRIADMDQLLRGEVHDGANVMQQAVRNQLEFQGAGPTASLWMTRSIACSRFSFYSNLRGAFLIGETDQRIYEMRNAGGIELEDRAVHREIITNAECSVGLQFGQSLTPRCGAFMRVGYEAQVWLDAGGPVNSDSTIGLDGVAFALGMSL
jgi:hypothetical protein